MTRFSITGTRAHALRLWYVPLDPLWQGPTGWHARGNVSHVCVRGFVRVCVPVRVSVPAQPSHGRVGIVYRRTRGERASALHLHALQILSR